MCNLAVIDFKNNNLTPYLHIKSHRNLDQHIRVSNKPLTIGRGQNCDIVLNDRSISREHCCIWIDENEDIHILDLQSTNGSKIDGRQIKHQLLLARNRLRIGSHVIKLEYKDWEDIRRIH